MGGSAAHVLAPQPISWNLPSFQPQRHAFSGLC